VTEAPRVVGHQKSIRQQNQQLVAGLEYASASYDGVMAALFFAVLAYCRAFFISRHRLGLEVAALRQQLVVQA
jgi:hypothetical protein